jgi:hypothetical protein
MCFGPLVVHSVKSWFHIRVRVTNLQELVGRTTVILTTPAIHISLYDDDDQWGYSPGRALASLTGFMIVCSTMWGYQLHDRPIPDTVI